jgi:hypothetical protein
MSEIITQSLADVINRAWHQLEAVGWSDQGRYPGGLVVRSPQGDIKRWTYADILTAADALKPREIPDESRIHLGRLFIKAIVDPADYATSQTIWRVPVPNEAQLRGPQNIREILTDAGLDWFANCRTDTVPLNTSGHIPAYRRLLKRDGMRSIMTSGDDLLILSLSDDGIIDMVRAGRSVEAYARDHICSTAAADDALARGLEAAYDADQGDYGTTGTICFAIPSGDRVTSCEMG